jgi:hypothetical protein
MASIDKKAMRQTRVWQEVCVGRKKHTHVNEKIEMKDMRYDVMMTSWG